MIYGIVKWIIISLIIIMLAHHLFSFLKNTLTVPKIKDLIHQPTQSYKEIEETLSSNPVKLVEPVKPVNNDIDPKEMKNELKNFFNELSQNKNDMVSSSSIFSQQEGFSKNIYSELI